jgi:hypothetical protein
MTSLEKTWRERAEAIREKSRPLQARVNEIKAKLKRCSEFEGEALLVELVRLNRQIGSMAREASNADAMALGEIGALR